MLKEFNCAAIIVHHTPKNNNRDTSQYRASDWAYAGSGSADIVNWARAILVIDPSKEDGKFRFIAAKRGSRIGWKSSTGENELKRWFKHSSGSICWEEAEEPLGGSSQYTEDTLYELMPKGQCMPKNVFIETAKVAVGMPKKRADSLLSKLLFNGRLVEDKLPRSGTNPQKVIRRPETAPLPNAIVDKTPKKQTKLVKKKAVVVNFSRDSEEASSYIEFIEDKAV